VGKHRNNGIPKVAFLHSFLLCLSLTHTQERILCRRRIMCIFLSQPPSRHLLKYQSREMLKENQSLRSFGCCFNLAQFFFCSTCETPFFPDLVHMAQSVKESFGQHGRLWAVPPAWFSPVCLVLFVRWFKKR
jgi:hypothetical protein